jgi:hypothetical protein
MVTQKLTFSPLSRRQIEADFSGGHITSDAGLLLLREVDKQHRLTQRRSRGQVLHFAPALPFGCNRLILSRLN